MTATAKEVMKRIRVAADEFRAKGPSPTPVSKDRAILDELRAVSPSMPVHDAKAKLLELAEKARAL